MESERVIGKLEEQGRQHETQLKDYMRHVDTRLTRIEGKIETLLEFKWRAMGAAMFIAFLATLVVEIARAHG